MDMGSIIIIDQMHTCMHAVHAPNCMSSDPMHACMWTQADVSKESVYPNYKTEQNQYYYAAWRDGYIIHPWSLVISGRIEYIIIFM